VEQVEVENQADVVHHREVQLQEQKEQLIQVVEAEFQELYQPQLMVDQE
jgi:hypothetical protein|tara:strand:+ start:419 stop:565 length:147 start_codon:yes stop_codon:yes gene_type:complete